MRRDPLDIPTIRPFLERLPLQRCKKHGKMWVFGTCKSDSPLQNAATHVL